MYLYSHTKPHGTRMYGTVYAYTTSANTRGKQTLRCVSVGSTNHSRLPQELATAQHTYIHS